MLNKELYFTEPTPTSILNDGVVDVVAGKDAVLKYELKTFVCEGKYEDGLVKVISNFCANFGKETMPAVWVSGFYGSGKSHLVKMLAQLWENKPLPDGSLPRSLANLPDSVNEQLAELNALAKRNGGIHAASGTLHGEDANDMKMAILKTVFRSVGLPESYPQANFVLWLRKEGKETDVRAKVEAAGGKWTDELRNLNVSSRIHKALCDVFPETYPSPKECALILIKTFPPAKSLSDTEFKEKLFAALAKDGKMPLTMIVMDEVQQYIGSNDDRVASVQSAVQACSKAMDGRVMLVATGQSALNGTTMLQKIKDRFVVEIQLQDMDITSVIRSVILRKKPECLPVIQKTMKDNIGEISKHLAGTPFAYKSDVDESFLAADYPILPSRRRFWEKALLALDVNGTDGQLRNLLKMNRDFAAENGEKKLGEVVEADRMFFIVADRLLNIGNLSNEFYNDVMSMLKSSDADTRLAARACGLVFLVNKLDASLGLTATVETLADLMVSDLHQGSANLRKSLPSVLDSCPALQKIGDCYRIQTKESAEWAQDFKAEVGAIKSSGSSEVETERMSRIRDAWERTGAVTSIKQGVSKTPRDVVVYLNKTVPASAKDELALIVSDEWHQTQKSVRDAAAAAGTGSAHVWVFIPKPNGDDFRNRLVESIAAARTIARHPTPSTSEGIEAKGAIASKQAVADAEISKFIGDMLKDAVVYQGGGTEVSAGATLIDRIRAAETIAADRMYTEFAPSDSTAWANVWTAAHKGDPDSLKAVGHSGDAKDHPIAKKIINSLGTGKKGDEIRKALMAAPYGWTRDAIDGALGALLVSGEIVARGSDGKPVDPRKLERKQIGIVDIRLETPVLLVAQQLKLCKLFQSALGTPVKKEELPYKAGDFLAALSRAADKAGGDAPRPVRPATTFIDDLKSKSGNDLLLDIFGQSSDIEARLADWAKTVAGIAARIPAWETLKKLESHAGGLEKANSVVSQIKAVADHRQLLDSPDPVPPLSKEIEAILKAELDGIKTKFDAEVKSGEDRLGADANWAKLAPERRNQIRNACSLAGNDIKLDVKTGSAIDILNSLAVYHSLAALRDKTAALKKRYDDALAAAAKDMEPQLQYFSYPQETLKTDADVDAWIAKVAAQMKSMLPKGPVRT